MADEEDSARFFGVSRNELAVSIVMHSVNTRNTVYKTLFLGPSSYDFSVKHSAFAETLLVRNKLPKHHGCTFVHHLTVTSGMVGILCSGSLLEQVDSHNAFSKWVK